MFGKTLESLRGSTIVFPPSTLLRVSRIASSTMALPAVRAVISRLSRIGTPEEVSVARVRQNRATAIFRRIIPMMGVARFCRTLEIGRHTSELQSHHELVCRLLLATKSMVDAGFENQKELTKMQLDNQ